ncbi:MAG: hypothetical protein ACERKX_13730 [Anaerolineales bacterium]
MTPASAAAGVSQPSASFSCPYGTVQSRWPETSASTSVRSQLPSQSSALIV